MKRAALQPIKNLGSIDPSWQSLSEHPPDIFDLISVSGNEYEYSFSGNVDGGLDEKVSQFNVEDVKESTENAWRRSTTLSLSGPPLYPGITKKLKGLTNIQSFLNQHGATQLIVNLIKDSNTSEKIFVETISLANGLLLNGNPRVQVSTVGKLNYLYFVLFINIAYIFWLMNTFYCRNECRFRYSSTRTFSQPSHLFNESKFIQCTKTNVFILDF
ncbi:unnamed protein product [Protopolystoma xenopodis]|uniref:Uncharacterized protein n=1 Tax=Protopolystoma xenopodis TaxID=117903 RepID=A0A3S5BLI0_9PLAT|nr:unnamed protein product [Protopolystoma xenopodis]